MGDYMKKIELLSPAGNMDCLKAAIMAGCDAVYLGGNSFGARNYAINFDNEQLIEAINYAHLYGVKVYVTVNTLIYEDEVERFIDYIDFLHKNNVDALIMQDLGMIDLVRKTYPNIEIHASTQMHIHNLEGIKMAEALGIKRAVLARETDIETINNIRKNTNLELEIFIHGALCVSYSGQCLMSSILGGRSGNRGTCTQCCRMPYDLISDNKVINKDKYLLSTKDLNTLEYIKELIDNGVNSLKIEGRMKRPEYVYYVTYLYRKAIDSYLETKKINIQEEEINKLKKIFNRNFTKGFLFNEENNNYVNQFRPNHIGIDIGKVLAYSKNKVTIKLTSDVNQEDGIRILSDKEDSGCILNKIYKDGKLVNKAFKGDIISFYLKGNIDINDRVVKTTDKNDLVQIQNEINANKRKIKIDGEVIIKIGKPIVLKITDGRNDVILKSDEEVSLANKLPITKEDVIKKLNKLGDTPFIFNNLDIELEDNSFVRLFELNNIRRNAIDILIKKRQYQIPYKKEEYYIDLLDNNIEKGINVLVDNEEFYLKIKNKNIKNIYVDNDLYYKYNDERFILKLPRVINKYEENNNSLLVGEIGSLYKYKNINTDFSLNVTNSYTVAFLNSIGVKIITLSYELTDYQITELIDNYKKRYNKKPNLELIISSYPEVMISKFNLLKYYNINKDAILLDNKKRKFKVKSFKDFMTITYLEKIKRVNDYFDMGIDRLRINIEDESDIRELDKWII